MQPEKPFSKAGTLPFTDNLTGVCYIENIRLSSGESENNQNKAIYRNNTSGYTGVSFSKSNGKWVAQIKKNKKTYMLGYYSNPEDAYEGYKQAKLTMHEYHPGSRTTKCNYVDHRKKHSMLASKSICLLPSDSACFQDGDGVQKNINQPIKGISTMPTKQVQSMGGRARAEALSPSERSSIASQGGNARKEVLSPSRKSEIASQGGKAKAKK